MSVSFSDADSGAGARANPIDLHVGRRIRLRRNVLGWSQEQLASVLGVSFQQVQKYERGLNRVGASRLHDLMRALDVPIGYFFEDAPDGRGRPAGGLAGLADTQQRLDDDVHSQREASELVRAFSRITDAGVRRNVLDLVRSLGGDPKG